MKILRLIRMEQLEKAWKDRASVEAMADEGGHGCCIEPGRASFLRL